MENDETIRKNNFISAKTTLNNIIDSLFEMIENKERAQDIILDIINSIKYYNKEDYEALMEVLKESEKL